MHILQSPRNIATFLSEAALGLADEEGENIRITSFKEARIMSANEGFVLAVGDFEFQVTVIRSK